MNVAATWLHDGCTLLESRCQETCSGFTKRTRNCAKDGDDYRYPFLNSLRVNLFLTHNVIG